MLNILVYPSQKSEPVSLLAVLREAHDAASSERQKEIDARTKAGIPLDDRTAWSVVKPHVDDIVKACEARDSDAINIAARVLVSATDGNALKPLPAFEAPPLDGVMITFVMPSAEQRLDWNARRITHWKAIRAASKAGDMMAVRAADEALVAVNIAMVVACIDKIDGLAGMRDTVAESMPGLRLVGMLDHLVTAAMHFVELDPKKALRCGQPQPST